EPVGQRQPERRERPDLQEITPLDPVAISVVCHLVLSFPQSGGGRHDRISPPASLETQRKTAEAGRGAASWARSGQRRGGGRPSSRSPGEKATAERGSPLRSLRPFSASLR